MNTGGEYQVVGGGSEAINQPRTHRMTGGEFLDIRIKLGLTQQALADRLGLDYQQSVSSIERGIIGVSGPVAAHMRTLQRVHLEYRENMARGKWR